MTFPNFVSGLGRTTAVAAALLLGSAALASAATLKLTTSFVIGSGTATPPAPDTAGLVGSTVTVASTFLDGATFSSNRVTADSTTISIAGASIAGTNGSFDVMDEVGLFGSATNGGLGKVVRSFFVFQGGLTAGGVIESLSLDANGTVGDQADGTALTLALLQGVQFRGTGPSGLPGSSQTSILGFGRTDLTVTGIQTSAMDLDAVAPVPLPAALPLMLAGLGGFGGLSALRRGRRAAA